MLPHLAQIPLVELPETELKLGVAIKTMAEIDQHRAETGRMTEPPHRHNFYTFIWHRQGLGQHMVDFNYYTLAANQVYLVAPGQVHQMVSGGPAEGFVILFSRQFWEQYGSGYAGLQHLQLFDACRPSPPVVMRPSDEALMEQYCQLMIQEYQHRHTGYAEAMAAYLQLLLITVRRVQTQQEPAPMPTTGTESNSYKQQALVQQFTNLVEQHHRTHHQVQHYADLLNLTPGYLNELIKSHTGRTAKEVITDRVLLEAKREALFTDKSGKEVAFELGFEDPAHFSKFFKAGTGSTFVNYRTDVRQQ